MMKLIRKSRDMTTENEDMRKVLNGIPVAKPVYWEKREFEDDIPVRTEPECIGIPLSFGNDIAQRFYIDGRISEAQRNQIINEIGAQYKHGLKSIADACQTNIRDGEQFVDSIINKVNHYEEPDLDAELAPLFKNKEVDREIENQKLERLQKEIDQIDSYINPPIQPKPEPVVEPVQSWWKILRDLSSGAREAVINADKRNLKVSILMLLVNIPAFFFMLGFALQNATLGFIMAIPLSVAHFVLPYAGARHLKELKEEGMSKFALIIDCVFAAFALISFVVCLANPSAITQGLGRVVGDVTPWVGFFFTVCIGVIQLGTAAAVFCRQYYKDDDLP
jgi:hypothetical protein